MLVVVSDIYLGVYFNRETGETPESLPIKKENRHLFQPLLGMIQ